MVPLLGLIVFLGVYPKPMLDRIEPSVDALIAHVEATPHYRASRRSPPATTAGRGDDGRSGGGEVIARPRRAGRRQPIRTADRHRRRRVVRARARC